MQFAGMGFLAEAIADAIQWLLGAANQLGNLLDSVGEILAVVWAPIVAGIAVIAVLRAVRGLLLLWRGRTPRVQVSTFAWATSDGAEQEATWVTSLFREELAALRLDALDPLPERAPGAQLVEIVEGVGQGVGRDIGAAAGRLYRAVLPDSAYEVWGTLRPQKDGGGKISIQLIERRKGNRTLLSVALEDASWQEGARQAAMAVAGALYPRVREQDRGPWPLWERSVPRQLMDHYHSARRFEEENRLEHALSAYHSALGLDPLNPNLRLKIAMLQERMELYLDAWVTYEAIVDEKDRRAWRGPNRRVYLLALYRLAVMLSNGCVATQWVKQASVGEHEGLRRDRERQELRRDLMLSLESNPMFQRHRLEHSSNELLIARAPRTISYRLRRASADGLMAVLRWLDADATEMGDVLRPFQEVETSEDEKERALQIEPVLQILGLRRLEELETSLRRLWPSRPRNRRDRRIRRAARKTLFRRTEFGRNAVRTSKRLVRTRIAASLENQVERRVARREDFGEAGRWIREIREAHRKMTRHWPFPALSHWRRALHWLAPRRRWENRREDAWQIHYNAACATASMLRDESVFANSEEGARTKWLENLPPDLCALPSGMDESEIVRCAIAQLEEYAFRAGSDRVAAQADWVAIDDPDLSGLRETRQFKLWASHHLPLEVPKGSASRRADVKRFTVRIVHQGARVFAASWRDRASQNSPPAADLVDWWRTERTIWDALGNACREHLSWRERLKWLLALQTWLHDREREDEVDFGYEVRGAAADSMSQELFAELAALAGKPLSGNGSTDEVGPDLICALAWIDSRVNHVRRAHEDGEERADAEGTLRDEREREEALRAARAWTRLAEILEPELAGKCKDDSKEQLRKRMDLVRNEFQNASQDNADAASAKKRIAAVRKRFMRFPG